MTVRSWKQVSAPAAPRTQARASLRLAAVGGGWQLLLIVWTMLVVFPFVWMVVSAFKTDQEIFFNPWALPATLRLDNFARAWTTAAMGAYFVNSLVVVAGSLALTRSGADGAERLHGARRTFTPIG